MIDCLASSEPPLGVTEIARRVGLTKSNTSRTLSALQAAKWVQQDADNGRFVLGSKVLQLGLSRLAHLDVRKIASPYLNQLRGLTGETALLVMRIGLEQMPIDQAESAHVLRTALRLGRVYPLWAGGTGRSMLAFLPEEQIEATIRTMVQSDVRILASGQVLDADLLRQFLVETRRNGFAVSAGERLLGVAVVAAPIFDRDGQPLAALSVVGPIPRFTPELAAEYAPALLRATRTISAEMGGHFGGAK